MGIINFLPVQEGTGDPSPTNVRPIVAPVHVVGKNLYNSATDTQNAFIRANEPLGEIVTNRSGYTVTDYIAVLPNTDYVINYNNYTTATAAGLVFFKDKGEPISGISLSVQTYVPNRNYYPFTTPSNCNYIRFSAFPNPSGTNHSSDVQLELGSTPTSYEPYTETSIYGGYLDVGNSELVEEWVKVKITDTTWYNYSGKKYYYANVQRGNDQNIRVGGTPIYSDTLIPFNTGAFTKADVGYITYFGTSDRYPNYVWLTLPEAMEHNPANAWIAETYPDAQFCYKLATPIHHSLNPAQLAFAMDELGVQKSSMLESRRRIMLNSPHLETVTGSTAFFKTDLKAPIKDCKIYFSPVQEGSGDPSSTNVRPIKGWSGVNAAKNGINLWDEEWELGSLNSNGQNVSSSENIRSKNYIAVPRNKTIRCVFPETGINNARNELKICSYNKDKQYIGYLWRISGDGYAIGENVCYIRFSTYKAYGTTYNNDISLNYPATDTDYHSYAGTTFPIEFPAVGSNLFGGEAIVKKFSEKSIVPDTQTQTLTYTGSQANSVGLLYNGFTSGQYTIILHYTSNSNSPNGNMKLYYTDGSYLLLSDQASTDSNGDVHRFITDANKQVAHLDAEWVSGTAVLYFNDCGIFKGNVPLSSFEPYDNTIYGGYLDLVNGELVATWQKFTFDGKNPSNPSAVGSFNYASNQWSVEFDGYISDTVVPNILSNKFTPVTRSIFAPGTNIKDGDYWMTFVRTDALYFHSKDFVNCTKTEIIEFMNDVYFVVKLKNPIHYQLTPETIKTLKGTNNIFSDTNGNIELKYWTH